MIWGMYMESPYMARLFATISKASVRRDHVWMEPSLVSRDCGLTRKHVSHLLWLAKPTSIENGAVLPFSWP